MVSAAAHPQLPGVLADLAPVLNNYGYLAVAGFVFLEDFGVPVPGETILIAAAVYAGAHQLSIVAVAVLAFLAAVAGDNVGFAIGHFGGRRLVLKVGGKVGVNDRRLGAAEDFFRRHGGKVVVVARFVEGLRQLNGIVAGVVRMRWLHFLGFNAIGAALWVATWSAVGYVAGSHITAVYDAINRYFGIFVGVVVVAFVARLLWRRRKHRRESVDESGPGAGDESGPGAGGESGPVEGATGSDAAGDEACGRPAPVDVPPG